MRLELIRHAYLPDVTLGFLKVGGLRLATLEERWLADPDGPGGQRREDGLGESCVPDGEYQLQPHDGTKWKGVHALHAPTLGVWHYSVPAGQPWGRSAILIHSGISTASILGCILVGVRHGYDLNKFVVYESAKALTQLEEILKRDSHVLAIRPTLGTLEPKSG